MHFKAESFPRSDETGIYNVYYTYVSLIMGGAKMFAFPEAEFFKSTKAAIELVLEGSLGTVIGHCSYAP